MGAMQTVLVVVLVLLMIGTLGVLVMGVIGMVRGGGDPARSNRLMRYRVAFQAAALVIFGLLLMLLKR